MLLATPLLWPWKSSGSRQPMPCSTALCPGPRQLSREPTPLLSLSSWFKWRLLSALLGQSGFFSCCCCEATQGDRVGGLRGAGAAPHLCDGVVTPPLPGIACVALSVPPRPPPGWREGAPRVGAGLEDYTIPGQGRPAAPLPARPVAHSLWSCYLDPPGERRGLPGGRPDQGVLPSSGPCWSPAGSWVGTLWVQVQRPLAGTSGSCWRFACSGHWLLAGPEVAGIPGGGTGLSRVGGSLCGRQSRTPPPREPPRRRRGGWTGGWQAPDVTQHHGLLWAGEGCVRPGRTLGICLGFSASGRGFLLRMAGLDLPECGLWGCAGWEEVPGWGSLRLWVPR